MRNLINWMCLLAIMGLVLQVMFYINFDVIKQFNKIKMKKNEKKYESRNIDNTNVQEGKGCCSEKIAK